MRDDIYRAPESANGGGLVVVAMIVGFMLMLAGFNWLTHQVAWHFGVGI